MVQKSRTPSIISIFGVALLRVALLCVTVFVAAYTSPTALEILKNYLGYQAPSGFFWGTSLSDDFVSIVFTLSFWSGIIFGTLGKWWDYLLISLFVALAVWEFTGLATITVPMLIGLAISIILGNAIGFALKLLRQKFLPKLTI